MTSNTRLIEALRQLSENTPPNTDGPRWCRRCQIHQVDDPRREICPVCEDDDTRHNKRDTRLAGITKSRTWPTFGRRP